MKDYLFRQIIAYYGLLAIRASVSRPGKRYYITNEYNRADGTVFVIEKDSELEGFWNVYQQEPWELVAYADLVGCLDWCSCYHRVIIIENSIRSIRTRRGEKYV